jgi:hypothetical protein
MGFPYSDVLSNTTALLNGLHDAAHLMLSAAAMLYPMLVRIMFACCATDNTRLCRGDKMDATANL